MARLRRISSGGMLALAINAVLALTALGIAFAAPGGDRPELELASAGGSLTLDNSKEGEAILTAGAMRPGQQVRGSVQIANGGSIPGLLAVARTADPSETPGLGGGKLSDRLDLRIVDVTQASLPVTLWTGKLAAMPVLGVGTLPAGGQRSYEFVATMPGGTADNAFQGASLSVGFTWTAVGTDGGGTPTATPTATPTSTPTATPTASATAIPNAPPSSGGGGGGTPGGGTPGGGGGTPGVDPSLGADPTGEVLGAQLFTMADPRRCVSRRKFTVSVRRPRGTTFKSLTITVNRKTKVKLKGLKARKVKTRISLKGLPAGKVKVKIVAVTTTGKKAVSQRTYKTCAKKPAKKKSKKKRKKR